ncbi:MAG: SMP-30/gluconolactonase/LRE family protein [Spirochaetaceae bacterium]|nr:SMP-30/gluconolactonase/LRE family protein [Spirochaetaceae bacterium]
MHSTVSAMALAQRVGEFERNGYTVFRGFNADWIERWRPVFMDHYRRQLGQGQHGRGVGQPRAVLRGLLQEYPGLFVPSLVAPAMLDFLEGLMGPTVGFDSLQIAITPPVSEREARRVHAWHRDMWALTGWTEDYLPPNAVNVLTYLQEGPQYGELRVIPGSHRGSRVVGEGGSTQAQKGEHVVPIAAGDTVVIHSSLLHTTSGNYSGDLRIFASFFYTRAWLPKRESYAGEAMQRVIRAARQQGERRVARLFEPDGELLARRFNGNNGEHTERQRWLQWLAEEGLERAQAAFAREEASDAATAGQDAALPRAQAPQPAASANPVAAADTAAADTAAGKTDAAPAVAAAIAPAPDGPADADSVAMPVLNARAELGEGPVWDAASGILYWVDLFAGVVHSYRPISGITGSVEVGELVGCVVPRQSGGLLAATASGIYHLDPDSGAKTRVSAIEADRPETHFNDGKVDPAGRFWFGSIAVDRTTDLLGDLYSLEPDLTVTHRLRGVDNTNGMDWSPDGRTMYYIDSLTRQVTAYDYDAATGAIANPRPIVTLPEGTGVPDGMTVSVDGSLWVAHWGGARVTRWHPDSGALLQTIAVPANLTTSCAFAGPAMDDLYITTARYQEPIAALAAQPLAGGLFRYRTDTRGRPAAVFAG